MLLRSGRLLRLGGRAAVATATVGVASHIATCETVRTPEQMAQPTALAAHLRWLVEEADPDYTPPDGSWPEPAERPRPEDEATLRRSLAKCGEVTDDKCHRIGAQLAICLLGGALSPSASPAAQPLADPKPESIQEGVMLLQTLSARGCADAACGLGLCYENGLGVEADVELAVEYFTIAAEHGHKHGQNALGCAYYLGEGTESVDAKIAVEWFERAATQSHAGAMFMLGECLLAGAGVELDRDAAYRWFLAAGELGHVGARERVRRDVLAVPKRQGLKMRHSQHVVDFADAANLPRS